MIKSEDRIYESLVWTPEEFKETMKVYLEMVELTNNKEPFVKKHYYDKLSAQFGRRAQIYPLRMQNISTIMEEIGATVLIGAKPATGVGGKSREIIINDYFELINQETPQEWIDTFPSVVREKKLAEKQALLEEKEKIKAELKAKKEAEKQAKIEAKAKLIEEKAKLKAEKLEAKEKLQKEKEEAKAKAAEEKAKLKAEKEEAKAKLAEEKAEAQAKKAEELAKAKADKLALIEKQKADKIAKIKADKAKADKAKK